MEKKIEIFNKFLNGMTTTELFQFAKGCHEVYCETLEFGEQNTEVVINLSNIAYYVENPTEKNAENHIKTILSWFKNNQDKLKYRDIPWCDIKGKLYCAINHNRIVQWWKNDYDKKWIEKNFTDSHRAYEFCYETHCEYVIVDVEKKYYYDNYETTDDGFTKEVFK